MFSPCLIQVQSQLEQWVSHVNQNDEVIAAIVASLNAQIDAEYEQNKVDHEFAVKIRNVFHALNECLEKSPSFTRKYRDRLRSCDREGYKLELYGSTVSGLCNKHSSDLDVTIIIDDFSENHQIILMDMKNVFKKYANIEGRYLIAEGMPR